MPYAPERPTGNKNELVNIKLLTIVLTATKYLDYVIHNRMQKIRMILVRSLLYKCLRKLNFGSIGFKYVHCRIRIGINMELEEKSTEHEEHECNESFIR
jgi:hypothetical protein